MTFFHYWKESLALIFSKNIKLLLFATAKAIGPVYKTLIIDFWWLFILCTGLDLTLRFHWYSSWTSYITLWHWILMIFWFFAWTLQGIVTFLIIRSSVHKKEISYFLDYKKHYICFLFFTFIGRFLAGLVSFLFDGVYWNWMNHKIVSFGVNLFFYITLSLFFFLVPNKLGVTTIYLSPFFVFLSLFLLDTNNCFGRLGLIFKRTINMIFYNYPTCLILFLMGAGINILLRNYVLFPLIGYGFHVISIPFEYNLVFYLAENIVKLFMPIILCFMANVYTVLVHNQVDLYFN